MRHVLPDYPRIRHLPFNPNATRDDLIANDEDVAALFKSEHVYLSEKIDGANAAIAYYNNNPVIRNRNNFLLKGRPKSKTSAGVQFNMIYNWFYENIDKFHTLEKLCLFPPSVYGEWMYARHSLHYTELPTHFIAFELFDPTKQVFVDTGVAYEMLTQAGFHVAPILHSGLISNWDQVVDLCQQRSAFTNDRREGIVVKICDGFKVLDRFKMVRSDFLQGGHWSHHSIEKNLIKKS